MFSVLGAVGTEVEGSFTQEGTYFSCKVGEAEATWQECGISGC